MPFRADQLLQCQQLLAALSWISSQGTSCGHVPDLGRLRQATEARGNALQDAALEDSCTFSQVQQALPADSRGVQEYPFASLLACLKSMFLSDPHGPEVELARTTARARMVLYYFWDSGIQCDWRVRGLGSLAISATCMCLSMFRDRNTWCCCTALNSEACSALQHRQDCLI